MRDLKTFGEQWLGDPIPTLADLKPRDLDRVMACLAEIEACTRIVDACYPSQRQRRQIFRRMRWRFIAMLLDAYETPPGGLVDVPLEWLS
jgi:hypothetical protein